MLAAGAALGMGGGLAYVAVRRWLPNRGTGLVFGVLMLAVSGRLLVNPHNIDFVILDPTWLGITMFASLPILFGLLIVPLQAKLEPIFGPTTIFGLGFFAWGRSKYSCDPAP